MYIKIPLLVMLLFFAHSYTVAANEEEQMIDFTEVNQFWDELYEQYDQFLPQFERQTLHDLLQSDFSFLSTDLFRSLIKFIFQELFEHVHLLSVLIFIAIFCAFIQLLQNSFSNESVGKIAYAVVFIVLVMVGLNNFHIAAQYSLQTIETMTNFLHALLPIFLALLTTTGGVTSSIFFHPLLMFLIQTSGFVIKNIVLPLLFFSTVLGVISILSNQVKVSKLASLFRKVSIGILIGFFTMIIGILTVRGAATSIADGVAMKTTKFIAGHAIPVVGGMFTEAADTVLTMSLMLRNTVGVVGAFLLFLITAFPAIKILIISFLFQLAAVLIEPISDGKLTESFQILSNSMFYIFASLAIVSFMFIISLILLIVSGNLILMVS